MSSLDLLMTDVLYLVWVAVVAPIGNSDHSFLLAVVRWLRLFQTCVLVGNFSWNIKSIGTQSVLQYRICPGVTTNDLLTILLRFCTNIWPCWLDLMLLVHNKDNLHLMINAGILLASSRRLIFAGPVIILWLTGKSLSTVKWELMKPTWRSSIILVTETGMFLWMPSLFINGWSTLNSALFDLSLSLPPLVGRGGGLVC